MEKNTAPTCANCRYSRATKALEAGAVVIGKTTLVCRRFPPQPMVTGQTATGTLNVQPLPLPVGADSWCGEHAPALAS